MGVGTLAQSVLGERLFRRAASFYRGFFEDLDAIVDTMPPFGDGSHVLEIGGGRGHLLEIILQRNPGARATLIDISPEVGSFLSPDVAARVELFPSTPIAEYVNSDRQPPTAVLLVDVLHHVPVAERTGLFAGISQLFAEGPGLLIIKDVVPGYFRSKLCFAADRIISRSGPVFPIGVQGTQQLVRSVFPDARCQETALFQQDKPNYCLIFSVP
jgi:cyclopropane fatty-acyl-phospholipid synthase-like methyltransferase